LVVVNTFKIPSDKKLLNFEAEHSLFIKGTIYQKLIDFIKYMVRSRMRRDIRFEANKTGFIHLFRIEANRRILHAKRIKTEVNIPF